MPSVDFPAPPGGYPPPPSSAAGQPANFPAPPGATISQPEADTQTQISISPPSPYQRMGSGFYRGDSGLLLGQRDFASTLNRPSIAKLASARRTGTGLQSVQFPAVSQGTAGQDGGIQPGVSGISQVFLPGPASLEATEIPGVAIPPEDSQEVLSKRRVRVLYVIFCAQKFCCELLGTLFLVTSIALAEKGSHAPFAPFSVSAVVYVLTFLFVPISGAHFNPAVSTAMFLTSKHFRYFEYFAYFLCQLIGGTCGALVGWAIMGEPLEVLPLDIGVSSARSIFHEVIPTILLIYTCLVLTFATNAGNVSLVTIPLTASMAVLFGAIAGAMMNPAVATGIYMSHLIVDKPHVMTRELMIGLFCPFLGAVLSVFGFVVTHAYTNPIEIRFIHFM